MNSDSTGALDLHFLPYKTRIPNHSPDLFTTSPNAGGIIFLLNKGFKAQKGGYYERLESMHSHRMSAAIKNNLTGGIVTVIPEKIDDNVHAVVVAEIDSTSTRSLMQLGAKLFSHVSSSFNLATWTIIDESGCGKDDALHDVALGYDIKSVSSGLYKTSPKKPIPILYRCAEKHESENVSKSVALATSITFAKTLTTAAPNHLTPKTYAETIKANLQGLGVEVEVLEKSAIEAMHMNCLLSVSRGSACPPYVVVMKFKNSDTPPIGLIGKGVTYDSGGLSLKPSSSMLGMKGDMAGSAAVVGAIKALAATKSPVHVIGIVGLVENLVGENATKPDDVIESASGKTVEIQNTDAEGRLVLADLMTYAQKSHECSTLVTVATLTGAIKQALGSRFAGLFANDRQIARALIQSGEHTGEEVYQLPLHSDYAKLLESDVADIRNVANPGDGAGSIVGAEFLQYFVSKPTTWAHLDIAGVARDKNNPLANKDGYTGWGCRLLCDFVTQHKA